MQLRAFGVDGRLVLTNRRASGPSRWANAAASDLEHDDVSAANGDLLFALFVGGGLLDLVTGDVTFRGTETFSSGTGRFADASGTDSLEGSASGSASTGEFTVRGTLTY
jgi:hypothetical protein